MKIKNFWRAFATIERLILSSNCNLQDSYDIAIAYRMVENIITEVTHA